MARGQLGNFHLETLFRTVLRHHCRAKDGGEFLVDPFLESHIPCFSIDIVQRHSGFLYTLRFTTYISLKVPHQLPWRA